MHNPFETINARLSNLEALTLETLNCLRTRAATPTGPPADELLSIREAAALLDVTVQTVHEWKRRGLLKYHKLGSRSYLKRADVLAALQGQQRTVKVGKGGARG